MPTANVPNVSSLGDDRTLAPATGNLTANAVLAHPIGSGINATFNGTLGFTHSDSLLGLPGISLAVPAGDPFSPFSGPVVVDRYVNEPLNQICQRLDGSPRLDPQQGREALAAVADRRLRPRRPPDRHRRGRRPGGAARAAERRIAGLQSLRPVAERPAAGPAAGVRALDLRRRQHPGPGQRPTVQAAGRRSLCQRQGGRHPELAGLDLGAARAPTRRSSSPATTPTPSSTSTCR